MYMYMYIYLSGFVKTWLKEFQVHFNYWTLSGMGSSSKSLAEAKQ